MNPTSPEPGRDPGSLAEPAPSAGLDGSAAGPGPLGHPEPLGNPEPLGRPGPRARGAGAFDAGSKRPPGLDPWSLPEEGPVVVAHRGSSAALPEHTIGAYLRAIDEGADGLECDVRLTRDGHLVCIHDGRLERTSNGTGKVSRQRLADLHELDFGQWHPHPDGGRQTPTPVLTLERLLDAAVDAGRPLRLFIETKHPTRYGGDVEARLAAMLRRYGLEKPDDEKGVRVTVMSFSALAVRRARVLMPHLEHVFLAEIMVPGLRDGRLPFGARIAGPGVKLLRQNPDIVAALHKRGRRVYVWTVNTPDDLDLVRELRVDAVISDRPRWVLDQLGR